MTCDEHLKCCAPHSDGRYYCMRILGHEGNHLAFDAGQAIVWER